jgi:hypothetical protein
VRKLVLTAAEQNFVFSASHVPGRLNLVGDALSRFKFQKFRKLVPDADPQPTPCLRLHQLTMPPVHI